MTGILLVAVIVVILMSGFLPFFFFILILNGLALQEYCLLVRKMEITVQEVSVIVVGTAIVVVSCLTHFYSLQYSFYLVLIPFIGLIFFIELFRRSEKPFQNIALTILAVVWISIPFSLYIDVCFYPFTIAQYNAFLALSYFIILWSGDTGAFIIGKLIGSHLLFKRISPKKTWEGSIGGFVFALIAAFMNRQVFGIFDLYHWLILAVVIYITGTFGDFFKSMLKRSVGVKDSGNILPGHGGIIDRFDTLIGSSPFVFIYLNLYG